MSVQAQARAVRTLDELRLRQPVAEVADPWRPIASAPLKEWFFVRRPYPRHSEIVQVRRWASAWGDDYVMTRKGTIWRAKEWMSLA